MKYALSILVAAMATATPAFAQSSLGFHGLDAELSYGFTDEEAQTLSGVAQLDVRITEVHGLQLDFGLVNTGTIILGQLGAHLYMQPVPEQKFGLFVTLSDVDDYSVQYMNAGIEGRFLLSENTSFDARFGVGGTTGMGGTVGPQWDYVFAGAAIQHQFNDNLTAEARVDVTEFDELTFRALGVDSQLRLTYARPGSHFEVFGEIRSSALFGQDAAPARTSLGTGLTVTFGGGSDPLVDRPFQSAAPLDQLIDRGIVTLE